ncbi:hypothetical protein ACE41H_23520 [Paenibacillus enshidis]|uniref:WxL domain-containing protein n=1 Tax=Paenibacillus enshidis TaxID=1458439 RepID=A0ABV5AZT8_9BACL
MKVKVKGKVVGILLTALLSFGSVASVSASSSPEPSIALDSTVPEGYRVVKEYDPMDESTKVDMQVEGESLLAETKTLQNSSESIPALDDTEILKNETHLYRELQNIETGDVVPQYITEMVVAADPFLYSGSNQNSDKSLKLTITLYYHQTTKNSLAYLGLDKAYWRYDKGSSPNSNITPYLTHTAELLQIGPGINDHGQVQRKNVSPLAGDLSFGKTYLAEVPSSWIEVLDQGLATEVGLRVNAKFLNQSTGKIISYGWSLTIKGKSPL